MSIKIPYSSLPGANKSTVLMPIVPLTLRYKRKTFLTYALVDSGATSAAISTVIADKLGIDWGRISSKVGFSASGIFRFHPVEVEAEIENSSFSLKINIIEGVSPYQCILGEADLFQRAKITFERYKYQFEISFRDFN